MAVDKSAWMIQRDGKQVGEWYFMKGRNVTVKKTMKPFSVLL